jgi:hypothetical protein
VSSGEKKIKGSGSMLLKPLKERMGMHHSKSKHNRPKAQGSLVLGTKKVRKTAGGLLSMQPASTNASSHVEKSTQQAHQAKVPVANVAKDAGHHP